jgi:hypothetical protein
MEMYGSRLEELNAELGPYTELRAAADFDRCLLGQEVDHLLELSYWDRRRMHNLKYFTWIEQLGKTVEELDAQWYDDNYWHDRLNIWKAWDKQIEEFNAKTGLLQNYK